ncbi:helix-turn-helix transcriptional regulator, partial [Rhizobium ruizarguesonis]
MDMNVIQASKGERQMANFASAVVPDLLPRDELLHRLHGVASTG